MELPLLCAAVPSAQSPWVSKLSPVMFGLLPTHTGIHGDDGDPSTRSDTLIEFLHFLGRKTKSKLENTTNLMVLLFLSALLAFTKKKKHLIHHSFLGLLSVTQTFILWVWFSLFIFCGCCRFLANQWPRCQQWTKVWWIRFYCCKCAFLCTFSHYEGNNNRGAIALLWFLHTLSGIDNPNEPLANKHHLSLTSLPLFPGQTG